MFRTIRKFALFAILYVYAVLGVITVSPAQALAATQTRVSDLQTIRAILERPDEEIDLAKTKLTIDRMIDSSINIESNLKRLDSMAKKISE